MTSYRDLFILKEGMKANNKSDSLALCIYHSKR